MATAALALALGVIVLPGCGGDGGERPTRPATTPPSGPEALEVPVRDAAAARDALVRSVLGRETAVDPVEALVARYPAVRFGSATAPADPAGVSVWWTPLDPYAPERPDNPTLFVVAVRDQKGLCAAGAATGVGVFDDGLTARPDVDPCTAEDARERLRLQAP